MTFRGDNLRFQDAVRYSQAEDGCRRLLSAQLCTGQHYHTFDNAQRIADAIGTPSVLVRPGIGDTLNHGA